MGGVAVLHPQDCLKDRRDDLFSTPVKSRRIPKPSPNSSSSSPNFTRSEGRKRSPKNNRTTTASAAMVADPPAAAVSKNLVMGQVKILKRGEALVDEPSTVSKDVNDRKVSNSTASSPPKDVPVMRDFSGSRRVSPAKKKAEKEKKRFSNSSPKIEILKVDDFALSSTDRLGPDPEMVPKQMKKNVAEFFFAGSVFVDSPPPSSLPLPGFFTKSFVAAEEDDPSTYLRRMLGLNLS